MTPEIIKAGEKTAVDFQQIQAICSPHGVDVTFKEHNQLPENPTLSGILGSSPACCILMEVKHSRKPIRHFLIKNSRNYIYFDSLNLTLEHMYSITQTSPKLIRAFSGHKVEMPSVRVQKNIAHVRDCGLHCSVRAIFHRYSNREYYKFLRKFGTDFDYTVTMMCLLHLIDMKALKIQHK